MNESTTRLWSVGAPACLGCAVVLVAASVPACSGDASLAGAGSRCARSAQCQPGLVCIANVCTDDLSSLAEAGMLPPVDLGRNEGGPPPADMGGPDDDLGAPLPVDMGPPPPVDMGPPPPTDMDPAPLMDLGSEDDMG